MLKIATLTFNPYGENTYVIYDQNRDCVIVDAGCYNKKEQQTLLQFINKNELRPILALNTHGHIDHVCGVEFVKQCWGVPFAIDSSDSQVLQANTIYAEQMGFRMPTVPSIDIDLATTDRVMLGDTAIEILHTPGHTPGGVSLYMAEQKILITGDTLFKESIGRTDLPGGNYPTLMKSILEQIAPLGSGVTVFPGHGPSSSVGHEMIYNPFIVEAVQGQVNYK